MKIEVALNQPQAPVSPLHGVNLGPIDRRWARDYSADFRRAAIPSVRLHDASLAQGELVDLHCIFPNPDADPEDPASYRFGLSDRYVAAIRDAGADVYFRLGESIEHTPEKIFIRPERWTPQKLAVVCRNIVRHYNQGWADGHEWDITYWEFWNEPDNTWDRPRDKRICWTGYVDEFFDFYAAAATEVKRVAPEVKFGLAGFTGRFAPAWLASELEGGDALGGWVSLIPRCVEAGLPIDFVSWHNYSGNWTAVAELARGVRKRLDALGLTEAESHLGEWNYVPTLQDEEGEYTYMNSRLKGNFDRIEKSEAVLNGLEGAAYAFGTLAVLQDGDLDLAHFYTGISEPWGLFRMSGRPSPKYHAFEAFNEFLAEGAVRVASESSNPDRGTALVVRDGSTVRIGIACLDREPATVRVELIGLPADVVVQSCRQLATGPGGGAVWAASESTVSVDAVEVEVAGAGITLIELAC